MFYIDNLNIVKIWETESDALYDLLLFVQFKKREKGPWGSVLKLQA